MQISKIDAAQSQLNTAIELYLHEFDLLSVHTLAWAAFSILVSYDEATNAGGIGRRNLEGIKLSSAGGFGARLYEAMDFRPDTESHRNCA
jgi:hypothetical protein